MIKRIIYSIIAIWTFALWMHTTTEATDSPQWFSAGNWREIWVVGVWSQDATWQEPRALTIIRTTINRVLSILWVIALILCLYWWFQMLTAAWDDGKVKTWTKILKNAAIWLVVIWLSRILVRFIFWLILEMNRRSWW